MACGPGCHLRKVLSYARIGDGDACGCAEYAAWMDRIGPDECERRLDEIVAHLITQAESRGVVLGLIATAAATTLVRQAIAAARREAAQTWPGLDEDDITGADEAESDLLITLHSPDEEKLDG